MVEALTGGVLCMRLFLIRHGESVNNLNRRYTGQFDAELTDNGRSQAIALRPFLSQFKFDKVYSSDLKRAFETSQLALPNYTAEKTPLIREIKIGRLENMSIADIQPSIVGEDICKSVKSHDFTPVGGENLTMLKERVEKFFKTLETSEYNNVATFAHGGVLMAALKNVIGEYVSNSVRRPNCAIAVFDYSNGKWMLTSWIDPSLLYGSSVDTTITNDKLI